MRQSVSSIRPSKHVSFEASFSSMLTCSIRDARQRFYLLHTDDILCLALHPKGELVATGQVGAVSASG